MPILEQFLTNHILIFIHPYPPILVWLPWFLHRWSRLHRRSLHLWRFRALRSSRAGRRRCRSHQRLGRWKTERAVISSTQTPNNAGLRGNSLQQYHTCLHGTKIYQNKLLTRRTAQIIWTFLGRYFAVQPLPLPPSPRQGRFAAAKMLQADEGAQVPPGRPVA